MKKIVRHIEEIRYEADDGQTFLSKSACEKYENQIKLIKALRKHFEKIINSGFKMFDKQGNVIPCSEDTFGFDVDKAIAVYLPKEETLLLVKEYFNMTKCFDVHLPFFGSEPKIGLYIYAPEIAKEIINNNDCEWLKFEDLYDYMKKVEEHL